MIDNREKYMKRGEEKGKKKLGENVTGFPPKIYQCQSSGFIRGLFATNVQKFKNISLGAAVLSRGLITLLLFEDMIFIFCMKRGYIKMTRCLGASSRGRLYFLGTPQ